MYKKQILIKILILLIATAIFYFLPQHFIEGNSFCIYKNLFGFNCPGCGTTRAFWNILHLNFRQAFSYNKLVIITFPLISGCFIHWIFKKDKNFCFSKERDT